MKPLIKIISGGQTGVDLIALRLAYAHGFITGGYATNQFMTEKGPNKQESIKYNMIPICCECSLSKQYAIRNEMNIMESDLCIVFSLYNSPGTNLSKRLIRKHGKDSFIIENLNNPNINTIVNTIVKKASSSVFIYTINFIGHRESKLSKSQISQISDIIQNILCYIE